MLSIWRDAKNLPVVPGRNIKIAAVIDRKAPNIFRARIKEDRRFPVTVGLVTVSFWLLIPLCRVIILFIVGATGVSPVLQACSLAGFELIDLAIGIRGRIYRPIFPDGQRLDLKLLRLKNGDRLTAR